MKKNLAIAFTALLLSCSENKIEEYKEEVVKQQFDTITIGKSVYNMQTLTDTNFSFAKSFAYGESDSVLALYKHIARRDSDTLFLSCDNNKIVKFVNDRSDENYTTYDFKFFNKDINAYVVYCSLYESSSVWLVNKETGDSLETIGFPFASPNKKHFVCYNIDLEAAFTLNGFELFDYTNSTYISKGLREINNWGPEKVKWKDDTTLIVRAISGYGDPTKIFFKAIYIK